MASSTVFRLVRWAIALAVVLTGMAMMLYPGGTLRDPSVHGYSMFQNSLSDLGSSVAWSGQANALGAPVFTVAFMLFAISSAACLLALVRIYAASPIVRRVLFVATGVGILSCAGLAGAALTPPDLNLAWHGRFTIVALLSGIIALLLFAYATALDRRLPRAVPIGWFTLAVLLLAWMVVMRWRPSTDLALAVPVTLQKGVAVAVVLSLILQSRAAERVEEQGKAVSFGGRPTAG
jgi:FtsH-binding integral membrane protein